mmetsp:Transcript_1216/g.4965  ORF Transcript_1216/g.4965 Transcript_1216/m.4965 type:complete len:207 (+) Transcript_1216:243-863(+)
MSSDASAFHPVLEAIPKIRDSEGLLTEPFLDCCRAFIPVVEKLGTGCYPVKADMNGNIERLAARFAEDQAEYKHLFNIVKKEIESGKQEDNAGCTKGLLWLKRAMDFVLHTLAALEKNAETSLVEAAGAAYKEVLEPFHGWVTYGAFQVALKILPSREGFFEAIGGERTVMLEEMGQFEHDKGLAPVLADIHVFLESSGCNFPDKV